MTELFYTILNMSISAGILILAVLLLRLFFRRAPKWVSVLLWGLVAVRLILPFVPESSLSLMPKAEWVTPDTFYTEENTFFDSVPADRIKIDTEIVEDVVYYYKVVDPPIEIHRGVSPVFVLNCIWLAGVAAMLVYMLVSYIRVMRCVRGARQFRDNIYTSESVSSPFVLGLIRPRIYLPENMDAVSMSYVIAHEEAHLRRLDHLWKPFGFLLLAVHWFNPLIWIGYILLCRDIEMACDERVVRGMNEEERADYSEALLECSVNRKIISACPLAFGEIGAKARIKTVLNYKKPAFWIVVLAVIASVTAAVCFLTNPMNKPAISIDDHDWYFERVLIKKLEKNTTIEGYQPGLQPKTDNAVPVNAVLLPDGEPMWYQLITGDLNTTRFGNHFILEKADSKSAHYTVELYRDTGELYSGVTSKAVIEPMKYGDGYVLTIYEYSVGAEKEIIFTTKKQPGAAQGQKKLTMEDVLTLSKKQTALTWEDFAEYVYTDEGAGVFRCIYEIDDNFGLEITGGSMHGTPMHIYLCAYREDGADYIDIREPYEDIEEFLERHSYSPSVVLASHISKAQLDHEKLEQQLEEIEAHIHAVVNAEIILEYQRKYSSVVCHPETNYVTVYVRDFTEDDVRRFEKAFEGYSYVLVSADAPLTLEDVIKLSHKGYDLTWEDFARFHYTETGSGLYIRVYEVDENFKVWIGGGSPIGTPMYIYLALADDLDTRIDIRDGGVEEFIDKYTATHSVYRFTDADVKLEDVADKEAFSSPIVCHYAGKTITVNPPKFTGIPTTSVFYAQNYQYKNGCFMLSVSLENGGQTFLVDRFGRITGDNYTFTPNSTTAVNPADIGAEYSAGEGIYIYAGNTNGDTLYGLMDNSGKTITEPRYASKHIDFSLGYAVAEKADGTRVGIDANGNEYRILPGTASIRGNTNVVQKGAPGAYVQYLYDARGNQLSDGYDSISYFFGGLALINKDNKMGLIAQDGTVVLPPSIAFDTVKWPTWGTQYRGFHHAFMDGNAFLVSIGGEMAVITIEWE